ncbi:hypothetical protein [Nitrosomonas sp.]|uniref:hypothetical protein n=1 Tax=Nitrosomonas sp. TaxID=42353 RepID=UPI001D9D22AF|nr:hypothetical protein [Nitrosomonas sp.]MBX3617760.1 hypothetical protein [Nitrosomonas sp.]
MKVVSQILLMLFLNLMPIALPAFELGKINVRGQVELPWQYTPERANTFFNPNGVIINNQQHSSLPALRFTPKFSQGSVALQGDFWLQSLITSTKTEETFFFQKSTFNWNINDQFTVSGGIDLQHWGSGYIWNPSNPFQDREINFVDRVISYKRNGNFFASLDWSGRNGWSTSLYFVNHRPREKLYGINVEHQNAFALKLNKQFDNSDVSLTYALLEDTNFIGGSYSASIGNQLELHGEFSLRDKRRSVLPRSIVANGQDSFFILQANKHIDWRAQFLIGGQYTTNNQINMIFEYLYNGEAYSEKEYDHLVQGSNQSRLQLDGLFAAPSAGFLGESNSLLGSMKRHYLFFRVADGQLIDKLEGRAFVRFGIQDSSVITGGLLSYPIKNGLNLMLGGQYYGKMAGSETAAIPFQFVLYSGLTLLF